MRNLLILMLAGVAFCSGQTRGHADALPLQSLRQSARATTILGTFSLRGYSDRGQFPDVKEVFSAQRVPRENGETGWEVAANAAALNVRENALNLHTNGRADWDTKYEIAPALVFTPKVAGTYALSGKLNLYGQENPGPDAIAVSIFRLIRADAAPVYEARFNRGQDLDLSVEPRLRAIKVAPGESLVLSVWRPSWHGSAGGNLTDFQINLTTPQELAALEDEKRAQKARVAAAAIAARAAATSDEVPYQLLKLLGRGENQLGQFALQGWSERGKFPLLDSAVAARVGHADENGVVNLEVPGANRVQIAVGDKTLKFFTLGQQNFDDGGKPFGWMPTLVFTPKTPGVYALAGKLELWTSGKSEVGKPDAVRFAAFKLRDKTATVLVDRTYGEAASVDLNFLREGQTNLQNIQLGEGESFALAVWRPAWHYESGGNLSELRISKVEASP